MIFLDQNHKLHVFVSNFETPNQIRLLISYHHSPRKKKERSGINHNKSTISEETHATIPYCFVYSLYYISVKMGLRNFRDIPRGPHFEAAQHPGPPGPPGPPGHQLPIARITKTTSQMITLFMLCSPTSRIKMKHTLNVNVWPPRNC